MSFKVTLHVKGPARDESIEIKLSLSQVFTIGRKDCNLNLDDKRVSRRHVSLSIETGDLVADDLGSHNGTYFNGEKISTQALGVGDALLLGDHTVTVKSVVNRDKTATPTRPMREKTLPSASKPIEDLELERAPDPDAHPSPVRSKTDPKPAPLAAPEYSFYRDNSITWQAIQDTYVHSVKQWSTFWQEIEYRIPFESSVPILAIMAGFYGIIGAIQSRGMVALLAAVSIAASTIGMVIFMAAVVAALKKWLEAQGDFDAYVAFGVYACFLYFPVALVTSLLGSLVYLGVATLFSLWVLSGFVKAFQANATRFFLLVVGAWIVAASVFGAISFMIYRAVRTA